MKIVRRAAALLAALAAVALPVPAAHGEAAGAPKGRTVVALTFDDGDATHLAVARMLQKRGMRGTFYINTDTIGRDEKLTRDQVAAIAKGGHEIGGHTLTHVRLTELTRNEQRPQICDDRRALVEWGYRPTTLAYPFGSVDGDAKAVARECGYDAARVVGGLQQWSCPGCVAAEDLRPKDRYGIRTPGSIREDTLLRQMKQQVLNAEKAGGGLVPMVFHRVCDDCGLYSTSPKTMNAFLDWLVTRKARGTVVKTLQDAVGARFRPLPARDASS
ncbi:peptidoglycan/xylan/chitin deacetylase (PgdA/CDA1 family) [Streptosporangium becharense]|uniref:Peptidoglycan/xylan/chitin deacetylase (PgdA/CDA1 family) n=1 Tax=Streptosporangium becharense TaxID=1816182 RepID=A0A7W9IEP5_9ACTN|nr:polysaccharide deacetylase family protein [Streptosporangium becharense]MBB2909909.1 peptidoglycan/xylan/chitin deacetylase (PgdA/CDA1 family) [Streptosporangium becharense]MBB5819136.1 peptidoglycan/xylan/chitin deacetylase (PgdA/CDA1 family) [Streptosporangium becharense]